MKSVRKALTAVCASALTVTCGLALYACGGDPQPTVFDYTVTVKLPDGSVLPDLEVQLAPVTNGVEGEKTQSVKVDSEGKATFSFDSEVTCNIYVTGFPDYYLMPAGPICVTPAAKTANITLSYDLKTPLSGDGTAVYLEDILNPDIKRFVPSEYKGYEVDAGVYEGTVANADTTVYYLFHPTKSGIYTLFTEGTTDTTFQQYPGSTQVIYIHDDPQYKADDISETNKNFSYTIEVTDEHIIQSAAFYFFGISAKNITAPADYRLIITRTGEYEAPVFLPTNNVQPAETPLPFGSPCNIAASNKVNDKIDWLFPDGRTKAVKHSDGYYYTEDGALIWAALDAPVRGENLDGTRLYEIDFDEIGQELASNLTFTDGETFKDNYHDFVRAYKAVSNNEGFYPVNDELKDFLALFARANKAWIEDHRLSVTDEYGWMFACGTYKTVQSPAGSTAENPIEIDFGTQKLFISANTRVYYKLNLTSNLDSDAVALTSSTAGLTISDGTSSYTVAENSSVNVPIVKEKLATYTFSVVCNADQQCASFSLRVLGGVMNNPLELVCSETPVNVTIAAANDKMWYRIDPEKLPAGAEGVTISSSSTGLTLVADGAAPAVNETAATNKPLSVTLTTIDLRTPFYFTAASAGSYAFTVTENIAEPGSSQGTAVDITLGQQSITCVQSEGGSLSFWATYTVESSGIYEFALADATNANGDIVQITYYDENDIAYVTDLGETRGTSGNTDAHKILVRLNEGQKIFLQFISGSEQPDIEFTFDKQ
ncbi:MAG: hypothetical protein K2L87_01090 [Clostridiales bacterium]|nr:hypothetical protein [Clostridiales bacterium]